MTLGAIVGRLTTVACWLLLAVLPAHGEKRVALVIGNSTYEGIPALANPTNDADDMAAALQRVGFTVQVERNLTKRGMENALIQFARLAENSDAALFFYAGHGIQYRGVNFLMPIDARLADEISINYELVRIDDVLFSLDRSRGVKLVVLDACRNNPLYERLVQRNPTRDLLSTRGLARIDPARGTLIAYATQANQVAVDGTGRNSPFTKALLNYIDEPGLEVGLLFRRVAVDVERATSGRQMPELWVSLRGEFYLNGGETDAQAWSKVRSSIDRAQIEDFIKRYPASALAADARQRIEAIERVDRARAEQIRAEQERIAREQLEQLRQQQERAASEQAERLEREKTAREQRERERVAQEQAARELAETTRQEAERARLEQERAAREEAARAERARLERERRAREQAELMKQAQERAAREQAERLEREKTAREQRERERIAQEQAARELAERTRQEAERARLEQERASREEAARAERARLERERLAREQAEQARLAEERAARERATRELAERERVERERLAAEQAQRQQATEEKAASAGNTQIAMIPPSAEQAPKPSSASSPALVKDIKNELRRVGCLAGTIDEKWATADTYTSIANYARFAKLDVLPEQPTPEFLDTLKRSLARVCPLVCGVRQMERNGTCVAKVCPAGHQLRPNGECEERRAKTKTVARTPPEERVKPQGRSPREQDSGPAARPPRGQVQGQEAVVCNNRGTCSSGVWSQTHIPGRYCRRTFGNRDKLFCN